MINLSGLLREAGVMGLGSVGGIIQPLLDIIKSITFLSQKQNTVWMDRGHDPIHVLLRLFSNNFLEPLKHLDYRFYLSKEHIRCTLHQHEIGKVQVRVPPRFKVPPQSV